MTQRRQTAIKHGAVTDIISHLANLPERAKGQAKRAKRIGKARAANIRG